MHTRRPIRSLVYLLLPALIPAMPAAVAQTTAPVSIVKAARAPVYDEIPLTGSVESRRVSRISPRVGGFVAEVLVDDGDRVDAGAPLLRLDPVMAELELDRVKAELAEAGARLKEAQRQRNEAAELVKQKNIPATNYEARIADVAIAGAVVERLKVQVARQEEVLRRHVVYAPFDGVIGDKLVEAGQWVETSTALFELVETDVLRIDVPVPQYYFGRIDVGTAVDVQFDAFPDHVFDARVTMKIPVGEASGRTFPVRIEVQNPEGRIAPGMSARVLVKLGGSNTEESLLLPRDSIVQKPDGTQSVWIVGDEGGAQVARPVVVQTGRAYKWNLEIVAGDVQPGDRVVVRGNEILKPGQSVRITRELELKL